MDSSAAASSAPRAPAPRVTIAPEPIGRTEPYYASFSLDLTGSPHAQHNRGWFKRNLSNPVLRKLAAALSPAVLRVGGSGADWLLYNVTDNPRATEVCPADCISKTCHSYCLNASMWDDLQGLVDESDLKLVFNLQLATDFDQPMYTDLFEYSASRNYSIFGFEAGNEGPNACDGGPSFGRLAAVLAKHWPNETSRPRLVGPDAGRMTADCVPHFLGEARRANAHIHAFTYHFYLQANSTTLPVAQLETLRDFAAPLATAVKTASSGETQIWAGETGGHGHGGVAGVTDVYASAQWYLDSLGMLATLGHKVHVRQDLVGANCKGNTLVFAPFSH